MEKLIKTYNPRGLVPVDSVQRSKPGIGSNDQLDDIANQFAEYERTQHEAGECVEDCPHCAADKESWYHALEDLDGGLSYEQRKEAKRYQQSTFDRLQNLFQRGFKP